MQDILDDAYPKDAFFCSPVKYGVAGSNFITLTTLLLQANVLLSVELTRQSCHSPGLTLTFGSCAENLGAHGAGENIAQTLPLSPVSCGSFLMLCPS